MPASGGSTRPRWRMSISTAGRLSGDRASKTLALHRRIYDSDPQAGCVIHSHSTHLVALSLQGGAAGADLLPPITPYFVMKVGHVPLIPYHRPGDPQAAEQVAAAIERVAPSRRADPRGDARAAGAECLARLTGCGIGGARGARGDRPAVAAVDPRPQPLDEAQIDELRRHFGARW